MWERPPKLLAAAALALLTTAAFLPSLGGGWLWDDDAYVTESKVLVQPGGLRRIWLEPTATPQYYPLVHTSFWVERRLWGLRPLGYRVANLALHTAAAVLFWLVLTELGVPWPWLAAALFAVHPIQTESVAWVTERKNVLSAALALASALAYLKGGTKTAFLLFVGGLLSKTTVCSLPALLLLAAWWRDGRVRREEVLRLLPFFCAGLALSLVTAGLERAHVGAVGADWDLTFPQRLLIAGRALWFYAGTLVWPHPLAYIYPRWDVDAGSLRQWAYPAAAAAVPALLWGRRGPLAAALAFGGSLVPALGFFDVYPMRFSFVADHFAYWATLGPAALAAAGFARLGSRRAAAAVLVVLTALTAVRARDYRDLEGLWNDTLAKNPACWMCLSNLGDLRVKQGRRPEAVAYYERVVAMRPRHFMVRNDLGALLIAQGDLDGAEAQLNAALELKPGLKSAVTNLEAVRILRERAATSRGSRSRSSPTAGSTPPRG